MRATLCNAHFRDNADDIFFFAMCKLVARISILYPKHKSHKTAVWIWHTYKTPKLWYHPYSLLWAAYKGYLSVVRYLHENGADIHIDNEFALRWALKNGHHDIVRYLHEHGADIHAYNEDALRWAHCYFKYTL